MQFHCYIALLLIRIHLYSSISISLHFRLAVMMPIINSFFHKTKQETVDLVKTHMEESQNTSDNEDIYEDMLTASQNFITNFDNEDIYESMMKLNPDMGLCIAFSFEG